MTKTLGDSNMEESTDGQEETWKKKQTGKAEEDLLQKMTQLMRAEISHNGLEYDTFRMERRDKLKEFEAEQDKIDNVLERADRTIGRWFMDLSLEVTSEKLSYDRFRGLLFERFAENKVTPTEFFKPQQGENERNVDYIRRIENNWKSS